MKRAADIVKESMDKVTGFMPWEIKTMLDSGEVALTIDVREPGEYDEMHIPGSICIPRGIIEGAADWGTRNTVPDLAGARDKKVIVVCVGGERSAMVVDVLMQMGYKDIANMKLGLRGWNDNEFPLVNSKGPVDPDAGDAYFNRPARPEQMGPNGGHH
jgi:rhodanese-related sulfurtransferase